MGWGNGGSATIAATMAPPAGDDAYLQPYRDAAREHGAGFGVTLWASRGSQLQRFAQFTRMLDFTGRRVLDLGCSRGDLAAYLTEHGHAYASYLGVDAVPDVLHHARGRALPRTRFREADPLRDPGVLRDADADVIVISGTLNTMDFATARRLLIDAWQATADVLLFNFLPDTASADAPPQAHPARRLPTLDMLNWAFSQTWHVQYSQDYFQDGHDGTVLMHKR